MSSQINLEQPWQRGGARTRGIHVFAIVFCMLSFAGFLSFGMLLANELDRTTMITSLPCGQLSEPGDGPAIYTGRIAGPAGRVTPSGEPAAIYHATVTWPEGSGKSKTWRTCDSSEADKITLSGVSSVRLYAATHQLEGARVTASRDALDPERLKPECAAALDKPEATYREQYFAHDDVVTVVACRWTHGYGPPSLALCRGVDAYLSGGPPAAQQTALTESARYAVARMLLAPAALVLGLLLFARGRRGFLAPERKAR